MTLQLMSAAGAMSRAAAPMSARGKPDVPFLPGYQAHDVGKAMHLKKQSLAYGPGGAMDALKVTTEPHLSGQRQMPKLDLSVLQTLQDPGHRYNYSNRSFTHDERQTLKESARNTYRPAISPAWLKHDRQVLRFAAYFQEPVHEDPKENFRVRHCNIYFYLEDGTMMIIEPKVENSGIPQGTFVKRHRVPKPGGGYYTYQDLKNGITVTIYCRAFRIVGCDDFTRHFYNTALKMDPGPDEDIPLDAFASAIFEEQTRRMSPRSKEIAEGKEYNELAHGGNRKNAKLQQYLENDRKVLCFKCFWDDPTRYGSRMYYTMHYYLSDDTVEILESLARNSGRDPYPVFWRRDKLRWNPHVSPAPGMLEPEPIIYKPEDLVVGQAIMVYGRELVLYDCDEATRNFYRSYLGLEQESLEIKEPQPIHMTLTHPPHTGIGTEEDSLASCLHLTPRPPRADINKLMSETHKVMRFEARMMNGKEEDENRKFIIAVYVADNGIAVWESKQRNSGHSEGKFAQKSRKKNPATGTWFKPSDFHVGRVVEINSSPFLLVRADECTLKHMEAAPEEFSVANLSVIASKMNSFRSQLVERQQIRPDELQQLAQENGVELNAHELVTLVRAAGSEETGEISTAFLLDIEKKR